MTGDQYKASAAALLGAADEEEETGVRLCLIGEAVVNVLMHLCDQLGRGARFAEFETQETDVHWKVMESGPEGVTPICGQPTDGFAGPGMALRWWYANIGGNEGELEDRLGVDIFIRRSDGAAPCGGNVHRREGQAVAA